MSAKNINTNTDRKKEIVNICMKQFIERGLFNTSARDLAGALNMQPSGMYYYFKSKDEIVVACAEEAGVRLEDILLLPVLDYIDSAAEYMPLFAEKIEEATPMMKFFAQVCTTQEYRAAMQPVMERLKVRHQEYSVKFAECLGCEPDEVAPYLYACVAVVANYMIFGEEVYYMEPFRLIRSAINSFREREKKNEPDEKQD